MKDIKGEIDPWESDYKSHQGNIGLGQAISYFTSVGVPVLIPLNDCQKYDLAIDDGEGLKRVSVKTTQAMNEGKTAYIVQLRNTGGATGKSTIRLFDKNSCDYMFIFCRNGDRYLIPTSVIDATSAISVGNKYIEYKI